MKLTKGTQGQTMIPQKHESFCARVINNTNITFSSRETSLLEKRLKFNVNTKSKNWIVNLALEAATAIIRLPVLDCEYYRKQVKEQQKYFMLETFPILVRTQTQKYGR